MQPRRSSRKRKSVSSILPGSIIPGGGLTKKPGLYGIWANYVFDEETVDRNHESAETIHIAFCPLPADKRLQEVDVTKAQEKLTENIRLEVRKSSIGDAGRGLFAAKHFRVGEFICPYLAVHLTPGLDYENWEYTLRDEREKDIVVDGNPDIHIDFGDQLSYSLGFTGAPYANCADFKEDYLDFHNQPVNYNDMVTEMEREFLPEMQAGNPRLNNAEYRYQPVDYTYFEKDAFPKYIHGENNENLIVDYRGGGEFYIIATRPIRKGEEIFANYNTSYENLFGEGRFAEGS